MTTVSAKKTADGLEVRCSCRETFTLPAEGGEHACPCGVQHRYDGKALLAERPEFPRRKARPL